MRSTILGSRSVIPRGQPASGVGQWSRVGPRGCVDSVTVSCRFVIHQRSNAWSFEIVQLAGLDAPDGGEDAGDGERKGNRQGDEDDGHAAILSQAEAQGGGQQEILTKAAVKSDAIVNNEGEIKMEADGSAKVYIGPVAPTGYESNWVQSIKGEGFFVYLMLYGPTEAYFDKSWKMQGFKRIGDE